MEEVDEARFARLEAQIEFAAAGIIAIAGSLRERGILGDGAWNDLYATAESISHRSGDHWEIGRTLRAALGNAER